MKKNLINYVINTILSWIKFSLHNTAHISRKLPKWAGVVHIPIISKYVLTKQYIERNNFGSFIIMSEEKHNVCDNVHHYDV